MKLTILPNFESKNANALNAAANRKSNTRVAIDVRLIMKNDAVNADARMSIVPTQKGITSSRVTGVTNVSSAVINGPIILMPFAAKFTKMGPQSAITLSRVVIVTVAELTAKSHPLI